MKIRGKSWIFADNIDTDVIIPARYLNTSDPGELAKHCMEDADKNFVKKIKKGDIIVGGYNFGSGSSREHAPIAIKACGISCIIAKNFARIFFRNAFNIGLVILESEEAANSIKQNNELEIDTDRGIIKNITRNESYNSNPIPSFMQDLINAGGLFEYAKKMLKNRSI